MKNLFNFEKEMSALTSFRAEWANDIRESWDAGIPEAKDVLSELYVIAGSILLAFQQIEKGTYHDKLAMIMVRKKLEKLIKSETFDYLSALSEMGGCSIITSGTRHHIRAMFDCLDRIFYLSKIGE